MGLQGNSDITMQGYDEKKWFHHHPLNNRYGGFICRSQLLQWLKNPVEAVFGNGMNIGYHRFKTL
jgi:hypothetical protein